MGRCLYRQASAAVVVLFFSFLIPSAHAADLPGQADVLRPTHAVGYTLSQDGAPLGGGLWQVLRLRWQEGPTVLSAEDLAGLDRRLAEMQAVGQPIVLAVDAGHPQIGRWAVRGFEAAPGGSSEDALNRYRKSWLALLRQVAGVSRGRIRWYLLGDMLPHPGSPRDVELAAYEIKSASTTLRAEDLNAGIAVSVEGAAEMDLLRRTFEYSGDLDPYLDAVARRPAGEESRSASLAVARDLLLAFDPGASLWWIEPAVENLPPSEVGAEISARALDSMAAGADLTIFESLSPEAQTVVDEMMKRITPEMGLTSPSQAAITVDPDSPPVHFLRFFDSERFEEVVAYWSPDRSLEADAVASLIFEKRFRRGYRVVDLEHAGFKIYPPIERDDEHIALEVPLSRRPKLILVTRQKFSAGFELDEEESAVSGRHRITAEEIIAAHQRWRAFQAERLLSIQRHGRITYVARFGTATGSFDIAMDATYLWDRKIGAEWVIEDTFFNGVKLTWDEIPEIPYISHEKAVQVPLDLELDKRYSYELDGEEEVEGRMCWRLKFAPLVDDVSLYHGRAWIDQHTGALVQVDTVQTGLEPPMISSEERQVFRPYEGPDGTRYWLLDGIEGQQIYSIAGSNLVLLRETTFEAPTLNSPDFQRIRKEAWASDAQMLRDGQEGFKWLERTEDGGRKVREKGDTSALLAGGAIIGDKSLGGVIPAFGVNYTNVDLFSKGLIFNAFMLGVFNTFSLSDPSFLGTHVDAGAFLSVSGIPGTDRVFARGREINPQRVRRLSQRLAVHAGYQISDFLKVRGSLGARYNNFQRDKETGDFLLPADHLETMQRAQLLYDRMGWGFNVEGSLFQRSRWEKWGPAGDIATDEDVARSKNFYRWAVGAKKIWILPLFQKIEISARYQAGGDFDRFSAYTFGLLNGDRLRGFGGSGIRYDKGTLASLQYSFNLGEVVRFDAILDYARVNELMLDASPTSHLGVGVAANFLGPYKTYVRFDVGYALASDIAEIKGDTEFFLAVLRIF